MHILYLFNYVRNALLLAILIALICDIVLNPVHFDSDRFTKVAKFSLVLFDFRSDICNVKWLSLEREK